MLASAANCLPVWYLFESKDMEVTGYEISWYITSQPQHHKQSQVWMAVWGAVISICGPIMKHDVYWKQAVTCWLQTLDTDFCLCWDTSLCVTVVQMLDYMYRLLPLCHVYTLKSQKNDLLLQCLSYILKLFSYKKTGCSLTEFCTYSRLWKASVTFCSVYLYVT
jgi:hypothetical protein